jgi:hypothetical protein
MAIDVQSSPEPTVSAGMNGAIANDVPGHREPSVTSLVSGIIADLQQLIQQQVAMVRQEIRDDVCKTKQVAFSLVVGAGITVGGGVLLLLMLTLLLHWVAPQLPLWACCGLVGSVVTAVGGILVYSGVRQFQSFNPLSSQSVRAFKENLKWTTNPK